MGSIFPGLGPLHGPRARAPHPALPEAAQLRHCQVNLYLLLNHISYHYCLLNTFFSLIKTRSQDDIYIAVTQLGGLSDCCQNLRQKFSVLFHTCTIFSLTVSDDYFPFATSLPTLTHTLLPSISATSVLMQIIALVTIEKLSAT